VTGEDARQLIVIGFGMVGHRLAGALHARDQAGRLPKPAQYKAANKIKNGA
jgi:hypothetical protein